MSQRILICTVNWLGDAIMSLPALHLLRAEHPEDSLTLLSKPALLPLWELWGERHESLPLETGPRGTWHSAACIRRHGADIAFVFPNSFRAALIPFLAGVRHRTGARGHWRGLLLTRCVDTSPAGDSPVHQSWEYVRLLGLRAPRALPLPKLVAPAGTLDACVHRLGLDTGTNWLGIVPGAARGPSKRWPPASFAELGRRIAGPGSGTRALVLGTSAESELCREVARGIGPSAICLAGQTSLSELVALLSRCAVTVTNDSGGMHLAAAAGSRVVAIFGLTDPARTGPPGDGHVVVQAEGAHATRDIARDSNAARAALASVQVDRVEAAVRRHVRNPKP